MLGPTDSGIWRKIRTTFLKSTPTSRALSYAPERITRLTHATTHSCPRLKTEDYNHQWRHKWYAFTKVAHKDATRTTLHPSRGNGYRPTACGTGEDTLGAIFLVARIQTRLRENIASLSHKPTANNRPNATGALNFVSAQATNQPTSSPVVVRRNPRAYGGRFGKTYVPWPRAIDFSCCRRFFPSVEQHI